ncbi:MAG: hypothetical protein VXW65_04730 [Pseudomonadota bacterium]|nr:hypothetical protein [Pseudomonadota bacterium]
MRIVRQTQRTTRFHLRLNRLNLDECNTAWYPTRLPLGNRLTDE